MQYTLLRKYVYTHPVNQINTFIKLSYYIPDTWNMYFHQSNKLHFRAIATVLIRCCMDCTFDTVFSRSAASGEAQKCLY